MGSVGTQFHQSLTDWEARYRNSPEEHGAYFDKDGNLLVEGVGTDEQIDFDSVEINHKVEQRVWAGEEVNFSHNHPINTIFSPADVEAFEQMENHGMRAILPNGTTYTLIREQPMTSREWVFNKETQDYERKFEPKKIAPEYRTEYERIWDPEWAEIRYLPRAERAEKEAALDKKVAKHMEAWLKQNAKKYGYRFEKKRG